MASAAHRKSRFLKGLFLTGVAALLTIPFTILIIILLLIVVFPCHIYRSFVAFIAPILDPTIGKLLTGLSAAQSRDFDRHNVKPNCSQVVCFRFNGPISFAEFRDKFNTRVIIKLDSSKPDPTLFYPELRQYLTTFMGYPFLKTDLRFDYRNHVKCFNQHSNEPVHNKDLVKLWESLLIQPYPKNTSPWDITVVKNYIPDDHEIESWSKSTGSKKSDNYWVVLLRMHHCLADGFAIQNMLAHLSDVMYIPQFSNKTMSSSQKILLHLRTAILGPFDVLNRALKYCEDYHTLHRPVPEHSNEYFVAESGLISVSRVKQMKQKFGAAFTAVLVAAISGGMRNFLLNNSRPIPKFISTGIPFPDPEHDGKFGNQFSVATVGLALHLDNPQDRVNYVQNQLSLLSQSSWIRMLDLIIACLGCLPVRCFRFVTKRSFFALTYSTQPGPPHCLRAFNSKLLEVVFAYGTSPDSLGFGFNSITYNDNFRVVACFDKNLLQRREKAEELISLISKEFDVLEKYSVSGWANSNNTYAQ